jgi:predicted nucleic acid-binding protein
LERQKIRKYVLDSSIVVKWFVDEQGSEKARLLKDRFVAGAVDVVAPSLLKYEVINALRWHPIAHVDEHTLNAAMTALDDYQFLMDPPLEAWSRAIHLSYVSSISAYDGIYLGLAHTLQSQLVTADERLIEAVPSSEKPSIVSLSALAIEKTDV